MTSLPVKHGCFYNAATDAWEAWWAGEFKWAITAQAWREMRKARFR